MYAQKLDFITKKSKETRFYACLDSAKSVKAHETARKTAFLPKIYDKSTKNALIRHKKAAASSSKANSGQLHRRSSHKTQNRFPLMCGTRATIYAVSCFYLLRGIYGGREEQRGNKGANAPRGASAAPEGKRYIYYKKVT